MGEVMQVIAIVVWMLLGCSLESAPKAPSSSTSVQTSGRSSVSRLLGAAGAGRRPDAGELVRLQGNAGTGNAGAPAEHVLEELDAGDAVALELDAGKASTVLQDAGVDAGKAQAIRNGCGGLSALAQPLGAFCNYRIDRGSPLTGCLQDGGIPSSCAPAPRWRCTAPESIECVCACE
jgi:hypothetical protein